MTATTPAQGAAARAAIYTLLAALFDRPLDAAGLAALREGEMRTALSAAGIDPGPDFDGAGADELRERLAIEFSYIFVDPVGKIVPHEGLMLAHEEDLSGETADAVARFMAEVGYRLPPESGMVADHLAVELSFAADLAGREAGAEAAGDAGRAEQTRDIRRRFLEAHLGRWAGIAARRIAARDEGRFYSEFARFMADHVADDMAALSGSNREAAE